MLRSLDKTFPIMNIILIAQRTKRNQKNPPDENVI